MSGAILFDFDGTLAATVDIGLAAFNQVARENGFFEITDQNRDELRSKGPGQVMTALRVPVLRVPSVLRALRQSIREHLPTLGVAPGMREAVLALHADGFRLGIVTANSKDNVVAFLKNNKMECFDFFQTGMGLFGKAAAMRKLMTREGIAAHETIFVGDEIRDVEAAQRNGVAIVGVTWGVNSRIGLVNAGADHVIDTAEELIALAKKLSTGGDLT